MVQIRSRQNYKDKKIQVRSDSSQSKNSAKKAKKDHDAKDNLQISKSNDKCKIPSVVLVRLSGFPQLKSSAEQRNVDVDTTHATVDFGDLQSSVKDKNPSVVPDWSQFKSSAEERNVDVDATVDFGDLQSSDKENNPPVVPGCSQLKSSAGERNANVDAAVDIWDFQESDEENNPPVVPGCSHLESLAGERNANVDAAIDFWDFTESHQNTLNSDTSDSEINYFATQRKKSPPDKVKVLTPQHQNILDSDTSDSKTDPSPRQRKVPTPQASTSTKVQKKKRTHCKFCDSSVTNFDRHLPRNHANEKEVRDMLQYPAGSKNRKICIQLIRNSGHFNQYLKGDIRPMYVKKNAPNNDCYPCPYCKALIKKQLISKHYKHCYCVNVKDDLKKNHHQSLSQTMIACALDETNTLNKLRVKDEVLNYMKSDEISMTVKTDPLICLVGEQYLKKHRRPQMRAPCSNKMRELARLLIELRKIGKNETLSFVDIFDPIMFDHVVEAAKIIGKFDGSTKSYGAGSVSAHVGTAIKQSGEYLVSLIEREHSSIKCSNPEQKIQKVKRFTDLVATQWTTEISSLAFKDLNEKAWNKPKLLPLTECVVEFKNYVTTVADKAVASLRTNKNNISEYKNLVDAALVLTILYNRKRIGDIQYTSIQTYSKDYSSSNQSELINSLTETEKQLTKNYKRVITGGKGVHAVVTLFPQNIQAYMDIIINIRNTTNIIAKTNQYLFAHPGTDNWIRADTLIRKFANDSGVNNPAHITSNGLRKHIATVMQILNLQGDELEQFSQFMGHTTKTHAEYYTLTQDLYQTARISKLLILMDQGKADQYFGKSLSEIDIDPETVLAESDGEEDNHSIKINTVASKKFVLNNENSSFPANVDKSTKKQIRTSWTEAQKKLVKKHFQFNIKKEQAPKKDECTKLKEKYPSVLQNKTWLQIKTLIYNEYRRK